MLSEKFLLLLRAGDDHRSLGDIGDMFERKPRSFCHAAERIVGDAGMDAGDVGDQLVDAVEQTAAERSNTNTIATSC